MEDLIGIIALNHQVLFENFSLSLRKNKLLFTSLGRSVLGKTVHSVLSTGAQDLGHSLTQWITYLSLYLSINKKTHPPPPHTTLKIKIIRFLCWKQHAYTHWLQWTRLVTCGKVKFRWLNYSNRSALDKSCEKHNFDRCLASGRRSKKVKF